MGWRTAWAGAESDTGVEADVAGLGDVAGLDAGGITMEGMDGAAAAPGDGVAEGGIRDSRRRCGGTD
jgi:hypothetical protein